MDERLDMRVAVLRPDEPEERDPACVVGLGTAAMRGASPGSREPATARWG